MEQDNGNVELTSEEWDMIKSRREKSTNDKTDTTEETKKIDVADTEEFETCPNPECRYPKLVNGMKYCPMCQSELEWL